MIGIYVVRSWRSVKHVCGGWVLRCAFGGSNIVYKGCIEKGITVDNCCGYELKTGEFVSIFKQSSILRELTTIWTKYLNCI